MGEKATSHEEHGEGHSHHDRDVETLSFTIVSVTSSREPGEDESGRVARRAIEDAGHDVEAVHVVPDDVAAIEERVRGSPADVVLTTGGTGITADDVTVEALRPLFSKELPGVGERFRRLSQAEIGERAMLSRAVAGTVDGTLVCALPGSPSAVELGLEAAILPVAGHAVGLLRR